MWKYLKKQNKLKQQKVDVIRRTYGIPSFIDDKSRRYLFSIFDLVSADDNEFERYYVNFYHTVAQYYANHSTIEIFDAACESAKLGLMKKRTKLMPMHSQAETIYRQAPYWTLAVFVVLLLKPIWLQSLKAAWQLIPEVNLHYLMEHGIVISSVIEVMAGLKNDQNSLMVMVDPEWFEKRRLEYTKRPIKVTDTVQHNVVADQPLHQCFIAWLLSYAESNKDEINHFDSPIIAVSSGILLAAEKAVALFNEAQSSYQETIQVSELLLVLVTNDCLIKNQNNDVNVDYQFGEWQLRQVVSGVIIKYEALPKSFSGLPICQDCIPSQTI